MTAVPLVSLGMPVFNGEAYMERALDSLLSQTFQDFELVISDNGSCDRSPQIAAAYALRDRRLTVVTHPVNRGASWNFEQVFRHARGRYFAWTAVDDYWSPRFLEACVNELEAQPDAVTCVTEIQAVSGSGTPVGEPLRDLAVDGDTVRARWRAAMRNSLLHAAAYGLMRRDALARTRLVPPYLGTDHVVMTELALQGRVVQIPEVLAFKTVPGEGERYRSHGEMVHYLGGSGGAPWFLWLRLTGHLLRGIYHVRPTGCSRALLSMDAATTYVSGGLLFNDVKYTALRLRPGH